MPNEQHPPPAWRRYLTFWKIDRAADVDAELEFHVASRVEEVGAGPPDYRSPRIRDSPVTKAASSEARKRIASRRASHSMTEKTDGKSSKPATWQLWRQAPILVLPIR